MDRVVIFSIQENRVIKGVIHGVSQRVSHGVSQRVSQGVNQGVSHGVSQGFNYNALIVKYQVR